MRCWLLAPGCWPSTRKGVLRGHRAHQHLSLSTSCRHFVTCRNQVHEKANGARHTGGQLPEERIPGVDVRAFTVLGAQQSTFADRFAGVVAGKERLVVLIPCISEVQTALL